MSSMMRSSTEKVEFVISRFKFVAVIEAPVPA